MKGLHARAAAVGDTESLAIEEIAQVNPEQHDQLRPHQIRSYSRKHAVEVDSRDQVGSSDALLQLLPVLFENVELPEVHFALFA
jgi:hypothetical protein